MMCAAQHLRPSTSAWAAQPFQNWHKNLPCLPPYHLILQLRFQWEHCWLVLPLEHPPVFQQQHHQPRKKLPCLTSISCPCQCPCPWISALFLETWMYHFHQCFPRLLHLLSAWFRVVVSKIAVDLEPHGIRVSSTVLRIPPLLAGMALMRMTMNVVVSNEFAVKATVVVLKPCMMLASSAAFQLLDSWIFPKVW